ncbi:HEPN domain-containing protein [Zhouia sp. PK063]|uniref:HEPN domain-containing protein n=1 Tax=Zhouia sp. PK063 TaxID=3373602 RepID=UPI0037AF75F4
MKTWINETVSKLTTVLEVQFIFVCPLQTTECMLILIKDTNKPKEQLSKVLEDLNEKGIQYKIYQEKYAREQYACGNLFFMKACIPQYECFHASDKHTLFPVMEAKELKIKATDFFQKEYQKAVDFKEGVQFYLEQKKFSQTAFMLHQAFELAFRAVELVMMGKEKIRHDIASHQRYIAAFVPELSTIFNENNTAEAELLLLLDTAYSKARYDASYTITYEQIIQIQNKLVSTLTMIQNTVYKSIAHITQTVMQKSDDAVKLEVMTKKIKNVIAEKHYHIQERTGRLYYQTDIFVHSPTDIFYLISSILKICTIAMENADSSYSPVIPQPHVNIQVILDFVIQILPYDEMECFEEIINTLGGLNMIKNSSLE